MLVWVDPLAIPAWNRAYENRDDRAKDAVIRAYESFDIPVGTTVRLIRTERDGTSQVEVTGGPLAGRRGWTERAETALKP